MKQSKHIKKEKETSVQNKAWEWIKHNKFTVFLVLIFAMELFLRFYQMDLRNPFGYDQVDNAWVAKRLITQNEYPLVGMVAKQNSGVYIGPLYYYLVTFFYFLTNLNPVASNYIAGVTSIFTFWVIFYFTKKLFNREVALIAVILNTFSYLAIIFDRVQWPVDFIPSLSLIIFYLLYKVMTGDVKKIMLLAVVIGLMFNIHFTAIFFPIIVLLSLPFFPRSRDTIKYILISIPLFLIFLIPNILYLATSKTYSAGSSYASSYFIGFHLRRMWQIIGDAFIQFNSYLIFPLLNSLKLFLPFIFFAVYFRDKIVRDKVKFLYLVTLWFIIPWVVFSTYGGEISDYYFAVSRFICLFIISYLLYRIWNLKFVFAKVLTAAVIASYCIYNLNVYQGMYDVGLHKRTKTVMEHVDSNVRIEYGEGVPEAYIYYYIMKQKGKIVY